MEFCISLEELEKAVKTLKKANKCGLTHSLAVFKFKQAGDMLDQNLAIYNHTFIAKAHPFKATLDWGQLSDYELSYIKVKRGKLVDI